MLKINFAEIKNFPYRVLCLGAHSDDIEIGCGGTIMRLLEEIKEISVYWVVFSASKEREREAANSAHDFLDNAKQKKIVIKNFRESYFPYDGALVKEYFEQLKQEFSPDLIFCHYRNDLHQDHRLISELTWNTFRNHLILEYEILKYDGDLGTPNFFVLLSEELYQRKSKIIQHYYISQSNKHWFSGETFLSLGRLRGIESNAPSKYAEAFYCRKIVY